MYTVIPWAPPVDRMELLRETIEKLNPENIALDFCADNQFADGLSKGIYDMFAAAMTPEIMAKVISAEHIVTDWLQTRTRQELVATAPSTASRRRSSKRRSRPASSRRASRRRRTSSGS